MYAKDIISFEVPPLKTSDTGVKALEWMEEFKVSEIPVISKKTYLGLIEEHVILDMESVEEKVGGYVGRLNKIYVLPTQHIFDVLKIFFRQKLSVLPVADNEGQYLGCITLGNLIKTLTRLLSIEESGALFTLEMKKADYSVTELGRLIESDNAKVLLLITESAPREDHIRVTIKVNKSDISRLLHTFYRFNITVVATYQESEYEQDLKRRFDEFMKYLNI